MITRDEVKAELSKVEDTYLGVILRLIVSLERPSGGSEVDENWREFLASTYGSMADAPIGRGEQAELEVRDLLQ